VDVISTRWSCARCGAAYIGTPPDTGLCDDCIVVSLRQIFYGAATTALTADQAGCLRGMLADATSYRIARAAGCAACHPDGHRCARHEHDRVLIEAYRQLVMVLNGSRP